jgi:hypothetical protein
VKKPGWKPKKGIVTPKPPKLSASTEKQTGISSINAGKSMTDEKSSAAEADNKAMPCPDVPAKPATICSETIDLSEPRIYKRAAWKNGLHYIAFFACMFFDFTVISVAVQHHILSSAPMAPDVLRRELIGGALSVLVNLLVLPSIVFEARRVELRNDFMIVSNLLIPCKVAYGDIKWVYDPFFLKFAIIRTPRFFQLINKRDIKEFHELLHTIKVKAGIPSK